MTGLLQEWIGIQAQRRPDAVAVAMEGRVLTYAQLEEATNRFARLLRSAGCSKGDRVCFAIPKSPAAIVAMLGILKADCVHVPIDTASPAARVSKVLKSSEPRYVLGVASSAGLLADMLSQPDLRESVRLGWMESAPSEIQNLRPEFSLGEADSFSAEPPDYQNSANDAAHILFTSGSTGDPKGVVITHANVSSFVEWAVRYFGMNETDRVSCHSPLHFDLSTFDIFGAFAVGAELHLVPPQLSLLPNKLAEFIRSSRLTQWFSVPSVLNYMAKFDAVNFNDFPDLRRLLWCGEVFPTPALIYWMQRLPQVTFTNLYGPTEATIASSYYTVSKCPEVATQPIPIGTACGGEELMVLDAQRHPVKKGEVGDLYIGGTGLSPGYWRNPEATNTAFFAYGENSRIYRTGDLARIAEDGLVYFVGREDTQIKSRGYRIELGEIEIALNSFTELKQCAVVTIPTDGFEGNLICCAYVVAEGESPISSAEIRRKLSALLPAYMLPSHWKEFSSLPQNGNGKTDRRKLRESFVEIAGKSADRDSVKTAGSNGPNSKEDLPEQSSTPQRAGAAGARQNL
jgi:amino acid adenylation domain-containing protein